MITIGHILRAVGVGNVETERPRLCQLILVEVVSQIKSAVAGGNVDVEIAVVVRVADGHAVGLHYPSFAESCWRLRLA